MRHRLSGTGPGLLLLPGLACDERMWRPVGDALAESYTVVYPQTWHGDNLKQTALDLLGLLDDLALNRVGIAGLSMGGYLLFECLRQWPERIRAAVFADTTASPDTPERTATREQVLRLLREGRFEQVVDTFIASVLPPGANHQGPVSTTLRSMARDLGPEAFTTSTLAIMKRGGFEDVLRLLRVPTLFLVGELDQMTPPELARGMALQVPGSRVEVIPGAGHMSPMENPERVTQALRGFFSSAFGHGT